MEIKEDITLLKTEEEYVLHTEEMQDIISAPPSWLLRWGISFFFLMLLIMVGLTVFIHYPDLVKTQLRLNTLDPPVPVTATVSGRLEILVKEFQIVAANQPVASIETGQLSKTLLFTSRKGEIVFQGILLNGQYVRAGQQMFFINPHISGIYGEMPIPQASSSRVKVGQVVMIKLKSYPFYEYGMLKGVIEHISGFPSADGSVMAKVNINSQNSNGPIRSVRLKPGMLADAEIVMEEMSLFNRITKNIFKMPH